MDLNTAIICAGSNINPEDNIKKAGEILLKELDVPACARLLRTKPVGFTDQPDFINTAFLVRTGLEHAALAEYLKSVETRLGRVRTGNKFGPRTIDLDIAVFNGVITDPDVFERDFLRELILELMPELQGNFSLLDMKGKNHGAGNQGRPV
jgi:2-amino-4-hydroxy-6-hydroxymethyldihydropteridine diphosphokinase